jgi:hypothetical protein
MGLAVAAGLFLPEVSRAGGGGVVREPVAPETVAEVARAAEETRAAVADDPQASRELEAIESLERELAGGKLDETAARAEAARRFERAANALNESAREQQARQDELRERLAQLQKKEPGLSSDLARQLARGDVAKAAEEGLRLSDRFEGMSAAEREQLASELKQLAESIEAGEQAGRDTADAPAGDAGAPSTPPGASTLDTAWSGRRGSGGKGCITLKPGTAWRRP